MRSGAPFEAVVTDAIERLKPSLRTRAGLGLRSRADSEGPGGDASFAPMARFAHGHALLLDESDPPGAFHVFATAPGADAHPIFAWRGAIATSAEPHPAAAELCGLLVNDAARPAIFPPVLALLRRRLPMGEIIGLVFAARELRGGTRFAAVPDTSAWLRALGRSPRTVTLALEP